MAKKYEKYKQRKDGRFFTMVGTGNYKPNGHPERISVYAASSKELEDKVAELKYKLRSGLYTPPEKITVYQYAKEWLNTYKIKRGINTLAMYRNVLEKHIRPSIGILRMQDLKRADCQNMINDRWEHYETCNKIALTMKQIQKAARKDKIIDTDFWDGIELPAKPPTKKRMLAEIEKELIQQADFTPMEHAFVYLLYGCGIRREEAVALQATDFDLSNRTLSITHTIVYDGNNPVFTDNTKTKNGFRNIPIPISVYPLLASYIKALPAGQILLFTTKQGSYLSKSAYDKLWKRIIDKMNYAALPEKRKQEITDQVEQNRRLSPYRLIKDEEKAVKGLTAHIFRHNYATLLYYSGLSELKAVELMGHADGKMIKEVYAHLDERKENTVEKLDEAIAL